VTNPPDYAWRILAEGDSWFSFGSWKLQSLLRHLKFDQDTIIVSLAEPGDTIVRMADICHNPALEQQLGADGYPWQALLLSGGGNDVIDNAKFIVPRRARPPSASRPVAEYCDAEALRDTLNAVTRGYREIIKLRDRPGSPCPGVPLVVHTYDYCTPRNAPARFLFPVMGPWLYTAFRAARIDPDRWNELSDYLIDALGARLISLQKTLPAFHVVDTRGTLMRAAPGTTGDDADWDNEIHPNRRGFKRIAQTISTTIAPMLP
jgi:hypothetical protein